MKDAAAVPAADTGDEIAALIETLHDTEQRLEALTAGEVDTVANRSGRTLLLRRAQERLWRSDAEKQAAIVNALPAHVALIDAGGTIVSVNDAWRRFTDANGSPQAGYGVGLSYLEAGGALAGHTSSEALAVAAGLEAVLRGDLQQYSMEYACPSPSGQRWFLMTATPLAGDWPGGAIVMHLDVTERTLAAQASRQTAALLQAVADGTPDQVYVKDLQGRYLLCNRALADFMGVPIEQLLGRDNAGLLSDDERAAPMASDRRVLETGRGDTSEYSLTRGGQRRTFHATKAPYRNEQGELIGVLGISRDITEHRLDITERKLAELESRKLAEHLSNTLDSITDGFFTVDREWRYTHVNSQAERLMQRSRAELLGHKLWELFAPALGAGFEDGYRRAMAGETGVAFEAMYAPRGLWIGVNCYPSEEGLSVYFRDVSRQRASRRRLELLEASVSQLHDLVLIAVAGRAGDPALRIEFVNDAFVRATGHAREDVLGRSPKLLYGPRTDRNEIERLRQAGERREPVRSELLIYRKNGQSYWIELDMVPIVVHTEEHSHWVAVGRDITERRRDQQALRELNAELEGRVSARTAELDMARDLAEQANRAKSSFLATMSHEIRTPMNGVIGMIDVLEQTSLRASQLDIVRTARESAYALLGIVDDVLDFSKIEAGQFQIDNEPMSVTAVVEGMCDTLDHLAASKGVALALFVDPRLPDRILGDAARLRQVLMNLVGNAIKFSSGTAQPGRVAVRALPARPAAQPPRLELSVADNGIGMDDATLKRLFVPFTQADAGTTRRFGGTGLGLSISHRLVELMGGSIAVCSVAGQGTTFTVQLPLSPTPPSEADAEAGWPELQGQRCLVLGAAGGAADDLAVYLDCAGARVQRTADLASVATMLARGPQGACVAVIVIADAGGTLLEATLATCRAAGREQPGLVLRFVVIEHGRRRKPRVKAPDLVSLDGESLHRAALLRAVALAAGAGISVPEAQDTVFGVETAPMSLTGLDTGAPGQAILVAEDNEINQKVLRKQLALLGFAADIVGNGREALERWRGADYALLITDLHMPLMDGYELATAIRAAEAGQRHMPIVALTANAVKGEARRCHDIGMDDYMTKPVQLSALKALLLRWLTPAVAATDAIEEKAAAGSPGDRLVRGESPPADLKVLAALIGDDAGEIAEVLALFRTLSEQLRGQIRQGIASGSLQAVADAAHTLKSNARAIGALAFGQTCEDLEQEAGADNGKGSRDLLARFEAELAALRQYLESVDPAEAAGVQGLLR